MPEQLAAEQDAASPAAVQVAGRAVLLVPHRGPGVGEDALPPDHQRILAIVRGEGGPVAVKVVGEKPGLEVVVRGKLEPLRGKLSKLAGRGWLRKLPDGRFTTRQ
ncbi:hypothetical protein AB0442_32900 [Kitasatospora sp. NPDC085895]|uniref:hypothetical protein n=1 Tax=Kitasatospora sp. NPDC085895 TaxID=3155057 RepID=UPI003450E440